MPNPLTKAMTRRRLSPLSAHVAAVVLLLMVGGAAFADCPSGDIDGDCAVGPADLALLAGQWLTDAAPSADVSGDGRVDGEDLAILGRHWRGRGCPIVINELLAHSHAEAADWVELYNASRIPVDIGGWFLSDDQSDLQRYQIAPGTVMPPRSYLVLFESTHFANPFDPGVQTPFAFSENGETAYLFSGNDPVFPDCLIEQRFGASETGFSFGRYRKSTGSFEFVLMQQPTPGRANVQPLVGPVVINEIMYHPAGDGDAEYLELLNVSIGPIHLFDRATMLPWRFADETGIDFHLPADPPITLEAGEHLLLVKDPAAMQVYSVPAGTRVVAWGSGKLANRGERLRLLKPGDLDDRGTRYWIEVDVLDYSDGSHSEGFPGRVDPWPTEADGGGLSLNRIWPARYGNDPNNWHATIPTPGATND